MLYMVYVYFILNNALVNPLYLLYKTIFIPLQEVHEQSAYRNILYFMFHVMYIIFISNYPLLLNLKDR